MNPWSRIGRWAPWCAVVVALLAVLVAGWWRLDGGRWLRVQTPSMGTTAPVGTLLWVTPVPFDSLQAGDFIAFHPPGHPDQTYSHLVERRFPDGTLGTRGVIPASDPWRLRSADVIGEVTMRWRGGGWLIAAGPILLGGGAIIWLLRRSVGRSWRTPVVLVCGSICLAAAVVWCRPLVDAQQLALAPTPSGGAQATYIGTGMLPVRISAPGAVDGAGDVVLGAGEVGTVVLPPRGGPGEVTIRMEAGLPWWGWALLVGVCFVPAVSRTLRPPYQHRGLESQRVSPSSHRSAGAAR